MDGPQARHDFDLNQDKILNNQIYFLPRYFPLLVSDKDGLFAFVPKSSTVKLQAKRTSVNLLPETRPESAVHREAAVDDLSDDAFLFGGEGRCNS